MVPVVEERVNPAGSAGDTEKEATGPPILTTVSAVIGVPTFNVKEEVVY